MMKPYKRTLVISSILILLPMLAGILLWDQLPAQIASHWDIHGNVNGWNGKAFSVFGLPLILLAGHWVCVLVTVRDPKNREQSRKVFELVLWIMPVLSICIGGLIYPIALGKSLNLSWILLPMLGLMLVVFGNYLPKCRQNATIGFKVRWTMENEENWNAIHRFCGKVWVICGLLFLVCSILPNRLMGWAILFLILTLTITPVLYSYCYYRKQLQLGTAEVIRPSKVRQAICLGSVLVVLIVVGVIMLTGNVRMQYGDTAFTMEASYYPDLTVAYAEIDSLTYREDIQTGVRVNGFGNLCLEMGTFQNDEFGTYTRYTYTGCDAGVVLTRGDQTLVINGADTASTQRIYEKLLERQ